MESEDYDESCLFCKIAGGTIPATIVRETRSTVAFRDISPQAPTHVLVVPRRHVPDATAAAGMGLWDDLMDDAALVAEQEGLSARGYRLVINTGRDASQSVAHLHVHVLGGRAMSWPPG